MERSSWDVCCFKYDYFVLYLWNGVNIYSDSIYVILRFWEIGIRGSGDPFFLSPSPSIPSTTKTRFYRSSPVLPHFVFGINDRNQRSFISYRHCVVRRVVEVCLANSLVLEILRIYLILIFIT